MSDESILTMAEIQTLQGALAERDAKYKAEIKRLTNENSANREALMVALREARFSPECEACSRIFTVAKDALATGSGTQEPSGE